MTSGTSLLAAGGLDPILLDAVVASLRVSSSALFICLLVGVPAGAWLATTRARGRRALLTAANTGMGLPPVLVGLVVALLLWRSGPLGFLGWMYTSSAMIVAQSIIGLPIVTALTAAAIAQLDPRLALQLRALGASPWQMRWTLIRQARLPLVAVAMAALGRLLAEVGAVMMVGGNIAGETRVLTTAVVFDVRRGAFDRALATGAALLLLTLCLSWGLTRLQRRVGT